MANVDVKVKTNLSGVKKKLSPANLTNGKRAMANQILLDMDKFVPKRRGELRAQGHVVSAGDSLQWQSPYARTQFYGRGFRKGVSYVIKNYHTPGTGKRWDLAAKPKYAKSWVKVFAKGANFNG